MKSSISKFRTSQQAEDGLRHLQKKLGIPYSVLGRVAWSCSVQMEEPLDLEKLDTTGKEFNRYSITGEFDNIMKVLTAEREGRRFSEEDFVGKYLKCHIDRGVEVLFKLYESSESPREFWVSLLKTLPKRVEPIHRPMSGKVKVLELNVGEEVVTGSPVLCSINTATNPHMAIIGIPGSGKTQFIKQLLFEIRELDPSVNFLFLDYAKGDVAGDRDFAEKTRARVYSLPETPLPINPFMLDSYDGIQIRFSAEEKAESINSFEHLGPVQKGLLAKAIEQSYSTRSALDIPYPDFEHVRDELNNIYQQEGRSGDTLTETFRKLTSFHLFSNLADHIELLDSLTEETAIIDLHQLPALRELVAFFVIEKLYRELRVLPDSAVDPTTGARQLRTLLIIDEAHNYLPKNNIFLVKLIREMRSKGLAVVLLSQSPDDFDQRHFDYTELLEFVFVLKSTTSRPQHIQKLIRCPLNIAKSLAPKLANLEYPECITQSRTHAARDYTHIRATQFHLATK